MKPIEVVLACADAGLGVRAIHWLGWGSPVAAGLGTAYANDCTPTCAAGHFHSYRGVLLLSGSASAALGLLAYATAVVAIVGRPPARLVDRRRRDLPAPLRGLTASGCGFPARALWLATMSDGGRRDDRVLMQAAIQEPVGEQDDELTRVLCWRMSQFVRVGFEPGEAAELAAHFEVDTHAAARLLARGCAPQVALRILL